ncbi:uncharacterized protein L203_105085 [Cryptococcus depauperatus CBS 7841]|uniref:Uncharacterized protein n=1 Tax=Cryptococcus depauperatus CBS 7841 TaxID=1295531 RepID=A0A1E3I1G9_9TREE|nr:hypothetical protein L203_05556 [Cryptococcus depauperatus CBS 7841]
MDVVRRGGIVSTSQLAELHTTFQIKKQEIFQILEGTDPQLSEASKRIAGLRSFVDSYGQSLPNYDRGRYADQITDMETKLSKLRTQNKPRSQFAFSKPRISPISVTKDLSTTAQADTADETNGSAEDTLTIVPPSDILNSHTISSLTDTLIRPNLPPATGSYTLSLFALSRCVIDLRPRSFSSNTETGGILTALHAQNLDQCIVIAPVLPSSAMLSGLTHCLIIVGCQQFRAHSSSDITVLLDVASLPVIEHCKNVKFGSYPNHLFTSKPIYKSKHTQVQDFDWIREGPSPHWKFLPDEVAQKLFTRDMAEQLNQMAAEDDSFMLLWISNVLPNV